MTPTLREEDRRALDLLLDRGPAASAQADGGALYAGPAGQVSQERVRSAEKVLHLLDLLPDAEPPQDLVARTLRRLGASVPTVAAAPMFAPGQQQQPPVA